MLEPQVQAPERPQARSLVIRRVLIIAYHVPPDPLAALRPLSLARHLPSFGWKPTILANGPARNGDVETAPDAFERFSRQSGAQTLRLASRARELLKRFVLFPDSASGWIMPALSRALHITAQKRFDAIISSSPPASAHVVGCLTAVRRAIPWIADYRKLWYGDPTSKSGALRQRIELALERALRGRAAAITARSHDLLVFQERVFGTALGEAVPEVFDSAIDDAASRDVAQHFASLLDSVCARDGRGLPQLYMPAPRKP
jgi:glycosyl transferase family 4